jgi:magnesium chelatase subunit I
VDGLHALVSRYFPKEKAAEQALLMEFVLHGLASYSLISKKMLDTGISFKDLMGSMLNLGRQGSSAREEEEEDNDF